MSNIVKATVSIKGVRPLLWHHFGPDALPLEKQEKSGVPGHDPEEWRKTVLMTKARQLYVLPTYIFGSIRDGSKYTKKGKGSIQSAVSATLQVADDVILIDRFVPEEPIPTEQTEPVFMYIASVRNPSTKGRNVRYRVAAGSGWKTQFHLLWDRTVVSRGEMENSIRDAGVLVGLGDGRAIGFGRFEIEEFQIAEQSAA